MKAGNIEVGGQSTSLDSFPMHCVSKRWIAPVPPPTTVGTAAVHEINGESDVMSLISIVITAFLFFFSSKHNYPVPPLLGIHECASSFIPRPLPALFNVAPEKQEGLVSEVSLPMS